MFKINDEIVNGYNMVLKMEANEKNKGAFKEFPKELQPERIPLEIWDELDKHVKETFSHIGEIFIPDSSKKSFKTTTGDVDIIINPNDRQKWRNEILKNKNIIAYKSNGPQLMTVYKYNGHQYMLDFILSKEGSFEYRKKYAQFGTIIPAVVGSFARSLGYKFDQNALYLRLKDPKHNYHNVMLTNDFNKTLDILMLDKKPFDNNELYTPEQVVDWVKNSPRFDSANWLKPKVSDGRTIVVKNNKSHGAAKERPEVKKTYNLLDSINKTGTWNNDGYKIERKILGDKFIDKMLNELNDKIKKSEQIISGNEIMHILKLKPGPELGKIIKHIKDNNLDRDHALKYVESLK